ncbi:MAG: hypothetical protein ACFCUQ_14215 [Kiloniellales bacterium]
MARRLRSRLRKAGKPGNGKTGTRNPLAPHLRRRGHAVLPSARLYRRRGKHKKTPQGGSEG